MKHAITILCCIALRSISIQADDGWTLEKCTAYALEHSTVIRSMLLEEESSRNTVLRNDLSLLPGASIASTGLRSYDNKERSDNLQISADVSVSVSTGLTRLFGHRSAVASLKAAQYESKWQEIEIKAQVAAAYLDVILAMELEKAAEKNYLAISSQAERVTLLVKSGRQPRSAIGQMEAQKSSEEASLVRAQCDLDNALVQLQNLMQWPYDINFNVVIPPDTAVLAAVISLPDESAIAAFTTGNGKVMASQAALESTLEAAKASKGALLPTLTVTGSYSSSYTSLRQTELEAQLKENLNPSFGLTLSIPIIPSSEMLSSVRESRTSLKQASLALEQARLETEQLVRRLAIEIQGSYRQMVSREASRQSAEELMEQELTKFNSGAATALDYTIARNNCQKAESAWLQARWQHYFNLKTLEIYLQ